MIYYCFLVTKFDFIVSDEFTTYFQHFIIIIIATKLLFRSCKNLCEVKNFVERYGWNCLIEIPKKEAENWCNFHPRTSIYLQVLLLFKDIYHNFGQILLYSTSNDENFNFWHFFYFRYFQKNQIVIQ